MTKIVASLLLAFSGLAHAGTVALVKKPPEASAPWGAVGTLGSANSTTSGSTNLVLTTSAALESGNIGICVISKDESGTGTTDGDNAEYSSVADSTGSNTWTEIAEVCNMNNSTVANAQCIAIYYTKATSTLNSGGTITPTFAAAITAKAMTCHEFTGTTVSEASGENAVYDDNADPSSMTAATGVNREHLFIRATGCENDDTGYTADTDYTTFSHTNATADPGAAPTGSAARGEYRIATESTSAASDPTYIAADCASLIIALNSD